MSPTPLHDAELTSTANRRARRARARGVRLAALVTGVSALVLSVVPANAAVAELPGNLPAHAKSYTLIYPRTTPLVSQPRWDRCTAISWGIDASTPGGLTLARELPRLSRAFTDAARASGYRFSYRGVFNARTSARGTSSVARTGKLPLIMIVFGAASGAGRHTFSGLSGSTVGLGGSSWSITRTSSGTTLRRIQNGFVVIDTASERRASTAAGIAVYAHELGHALGLGHVSDRTQLMYPTASGAVYTYMLGDRAGLHTLAAQRCFA